MRGAGWVLLVLGTAAAVGCDSSVIVSTGGVLQTDTVPDFGHVILGRSSSHQVQLQNIGRGPLVVTDVRLEIPGVPDFVLQSGWPQTINSGQTREVEVSFGPKAIGQRMARLVVQNNGREQAFPLDLSGTGVLGDAAFGPKSLDFGDVGLGSSETLGFTFTNSAPDAAAVNLSPILGADATSFTASAAGDLSVPPNSQLTVRVTFRPRRTGAHVAELDVRPCPTCALEKVPITGNGIAANLTALPTPLDFGMISPLQRLTKLVTVTNHGTRPATISPALLGPGTSDSFTLAPSARVVLAQNQTTTLSVTFAPPRTGAATGALRIPTDDDGSPMMIVPLQGSGGGPAIQVDPIPLGFPRTAVGLTVRKSIAVRNVGLDPQNVNPLVVASVAVTPGPFTIETLAAPPLTIAVGRQQYIFVTYTPTGAGSDTGSITLQSNDPLNPTVVVPLFASASTLADCQYAVRPPALDFGAVGAGTNVQLPFALENVGKNDCAIANLALSPTTPPVFALTPLSTRIITPGNMLLIPVEFSPTSVGIWTGEVDFDINSIAAPQGRVLLNGEGAPTCFSIVPRTLDFGTVGLTCNSPTLSVQLENACTVPVNVARSYIGPGPSDAFSINPAQAGAQTVNPGGQSLVSVTYAPTKAGTDNGALFVATDLVPAPYLVPLIGNASPQLMQTDTYHLPPVQKVDSLWVIDNSGSMSNKQANLAANAGAFINMAVASGIDFHLAVTTTGVTPFNGGLFACPGGANGGEAGRFFPVDNSRPRILTNVTPNVQALFAQDANVGICHYIEAGFEAVRMALSPPLVNNADDPQTPQPNDGNLGFLRPDARLYVVWVTDEDDVMADPNSPLGKVPNTIPVQNYVNFLYGLKPGRPDMVKASAIIGLPGSCGGNIDAVGTRYIRLVQQFGGQIADICSPDWGAVINDIAADAFQPQLDFPLQQPAQGRTVTVTVNGVTVPANAPNGTANWHFDPTIGANGAVVFSKTDAPGPNSTVTITYPTPCPP